MHSQQNSQELQIGASWETLVCAADLVWLEVEMLHEGLQAKRLVSHIHKYIGTAIESAKG